MFKGWDHPSSSRVLSQWLSKNTWPPWPGPLAGLGNRAIQQKPEPPGPPKAIRPQARGSKAAKNPPKTRLWNRTRTSGVHDGRTRTRNPEIPKERSCNPVELATIAAEATMFWGFLFFFSTLQRYGEGSVVPHQQESQRNHVNFDFIGRPMLSRRNSFGMNSQRIPLSLMLLQDSSQANIYYFFPKTRWENMSSCEICVGNAPVSSP